MVLLENNCAYNEFAVRRYFFVLAFAGLFFSSQDLIAQTFTFDFLTYSDYALNSHDSGLKGKATLYVFSGENEFDQNGNTPYPEISYQEFYMIPTIVLLHRTKLQLNLAPQFSMLLDRINASYMSLGAPWLWAKGQIFENLPFTTRLGFNRRIL